MRRYELTVVISPDVTDDDLPDTINRVVRQPIESHGGEVQDADHWGRRKLAYPVQRFLEANYVVTTLRLDPSKITDLERGLHISEEVIRHLFVRLDDEPEASAQTEAPAPAEAAVPAETPAPAEETSSAETPAPAEASAAAEETSSAEAPAPAEETPSAEAPAPTEAPASAEETPSAEKIVPAEAPE